MLERAEPGGMQNCAHSICSLAWPITPDTFAIPERPLWPSSAE